MSRRKIYAGITSVSVPISVANSSTGSGLTGLTHATSGLVAEYRRQGQSSWTAITLVAKTLGTWISGGFVADGASDGDYELDLPNAAVAGGARFVVIRLRGAANMRTVRLEFELDQVNYQDAQRFGLQALPGTGIVRSASEDISATQTMILDLMDALPPVVWSYATRTLSEFSFQVDVSANSVVAIRSGLATAADVNVTIAPGAFEADDRNTDDMVIDCYVQETIQITQYVLDRAKNPVVLTGKNLVFVIETKDKQAIASVTDIDIVGDDNNGFQLNLPTEATTQERVLRCSLRDVEDGKRVWGDGFLNVRYSPRVAS